MREGATTKVSCSEVGLLGVEGRTALAQDHVAPAVVAKPVCVSHGPAGLLSSQASSGTICEQTQHSPKEEGVRQLRAGACGWMVDTARSSYQACSHTHHSGGKQTQKATLVMWTCGGCRW